MARIQRLEHSFEKANAFIGIVSNMPVIQLVHFINNKSWINFARDEDILIYNEKTAKTNQHTFYYCADENYRSEFCLLVNSSDGINLLPTHKQFNFFLIIQGAIESDKISQLVSIIKSISGVQIAAVVEQAPAKGLGPILQDLEIHLSELKKKKTVSLKRSMPLSEDQ